MSDHRDAIAKALMFPHVIEDRRNDPPLSPFDVAKPDTTPLLILPPTPMSRALGSDDLDAMDKKQYLDRIFRR